MTNVVYRGVDYPLLLKMAGPKYYYLSRIQDFAAQKQQPSQPVYEIGTDGPIDATTETARHSGSITWVPYSMAIFRMLGGFAPDAAQSTVTLTDIMGHSGIELHGRSRGLGGAVPESININIAVRQAATATASFRGTSYIKAPNSLQSLITAAAVDVWHEDGSALKFKKVGSTETEPQKDYLSGTGYNSFMADEITIELGSAPGVALARAQRVSIQAGFTVDETGEMGYDGIVDTNSNSPTVTCTIDFVDGDSTPDVAIPFGTPDNIIVKFGGEFSITLTGVFSGTEGVRSQVRGYATQQFVYTVKTAGADGGMTIAELP